MEVDCKRVQTIEIYYNGIGKIEIPEEDKQSEMIEIKRSQLNDYAFFFAKLPSLNNPQVRRGKTALF